MTYRDYFLTKINLVSTGPVDKDKMYDLMVEMLDAMTWCEYETAKAKLEIKKLTEKNQRQVAMIDNLEKTLWKK